MVTWDVWVLLPGGEGIDGMLGRVREDLKSAGHMHISAGDWGAMAGVRAGRMAEKAFLFCRTVLGEGTAAGLKS